MDTLLGIINSIVVFIGALCATFLACFKVYEIFKSIPLFVYGYYKLPEDDKTAPLLMLNIELLKDVSVIMILSCLLRKTCRLFIFLIFLTSLSLRRSQPLLFALIKLTLVGSRETPFLIRLSFTIELLPFSVAPENSLFISEILICLEPATLTPLRLAKLLESNSITIASTKRINRNATVISTISILEKVHSNTSLLINAVTSLSGCTFLSLSIPSKLIAA